MISGAAEMSLEQWMRSGCLVLVAGHVSRTIPPTCSHHFLFLDVTNPSAVIVRALASLLQHVGLITPDKMLTPSAFRARFNDQVQRYTLRTSVDSISSSVGTLPLVLGRSPC